MYNSKKLIYPLLLLAIVIISFWQISFMIHPLKYDMIDGTYPSYYNIVESIRHHMLPLWNPYQVLGYPIASDPQSNAWYPFTWLISMFSAYNIYSLHFEFLFHIFLAGLGMFYLAKTLKLDNKVCFIMSVSYMLSGFFIGNAQQFNWVSSASWIPFIIASYVNLNNRLQLKDSLLTALFSFLLLTGGYPAPTIILFYFMLMFFGFFSINFIRQKNYKSLFNFLKYNFIIIIVLLLLSSVYITSTFELLPFLSRANGITLKQALFNPFSPQCLISFLLPFAAVKSNMSFFNTDLSMSNIYIGIIPFIFFILSFFIKKPGLLIVFLVLGIFSLLAAFGDILPIRSFLFAHIPLMNLFRFPSLFRLFTIIFFIIISGYSLDKYLKNEGSSAKYLKTVSFIILFILFSFFVYSLSLGNLKLKQFILSDLIHFPNGSQIRQHIFLQSIIQISIILSFIILLYKSKSKHLVLYISILVSLDMFFSSQLNSPYNVYYSDFSVKQLSDFTKKIPDGYPPPGNKNVALNSDTTSFHSGPFWRNINTFQKQIAADGYVSCKLSNYELLTDSFPQLLFSIVKNPPVYLSSYFLPVDSLYLNVKKKKVDKNFAFNIESNSVYLNSADYGIAKSSSIERSKSDTAYITKFTAQHISINTFTQKPLLLNLLQNNYPGWKVFVNGKRSLIFNSNISLMSVIIPAGNNKVEFIYSSPHIIIAFFISLISFILTISLLLFLFLRNFNANFQNL